MFLRRLLTRLLLPAALAIFTVAPPPVRAQVMLLGPQLGVTPSSATAGGMIALSGSRLDDGTYVVSADVGRGSTTLLTINGGTGEFQRAVTLPALAAGDYPLALRVNGALVDSVTLRVIAPLAVNTTTTTPRAGSLFKFSVGGLAEGSLTLLYAGKVAYGPVSVEAGTFGGSFVLPTDRPSGLPTDVVLQARNQVGKLVPRVGTRTLAVQANDTNPLIRVTSTTASATSLTPRTPLRLSGQVASTDTTTAGARIQHFWKGADGKVVPMGLALGNVASDGQYAYEMRTPQLGTMSAQQGVGTGSILSVASQDDRNGVRQQSSSKLADAYTSARDTNAAVDIQFQLTGSDGTRIVGARIVMDDAALDELYPPNDNGSPASLGGVNAAGVVNQFNGADQISEEALGCPAGLDSQYTDANGVARFEFGLDVPSGGTNVDGSGPTPVVTAPPQTNCGEADINTPFCITMDPGKIDVSFRVQAVHTGYGWFSGTSTSLAEHKIKVELTVDRYTGRIEGGYVIPGVGFQPFSADRNALIRLTLPKLAKSGLALGDPYFPAPSGQSWILPRSSAGADVFDFQPISDLTPLAAATFQPATPAAREFQIKFVRGGGKPLSSATLTLRGNNKTYVVPLVKVSGSYDCDNTTNATETWGTTLNQTGLSGLPAGMTLSHGFRFPRLVFGNTEYVDGTVTVVDEDDREGRRKLRLQFPALDQRTRSVALGAGGAPLPGIVITDSSLHARRLTLPPLEPVAQADADAPPAEYNVGTRSNKAQAHADYEFCIPTGAPYCGQHTEIASTHLQFSRAPDGQPPGNTFGGGEATSNASANAADEWTELFNKTIPLFRWYWGVPEILSAEVFADLAVRAEYLFRAVFKPDAPAESYARTGGRLAISIMIGVDIDVLFGVLVDAGAAITGTLEGQVVATAPVTGNVCLEERLTFRMDFNGWLEVGCPIDFPLDPTCYIPTVNESFNILNEVLSDATACGNPSKSAKRLGDLLAQASAGLAGGAIAAKGVVPQPQRPPALKPLSARQRRAANRHPALATDGAGHRMLLYVDSLGRLVARESIMRTPGSPHILSSGWGVRDVAVTYFSTDRAVAVWAESDLRSDARVDALASHQFLRSAVWDGTAWSTPKNLTTPGFGDGSVKLARCKPDPLRLRSDCQSNRASVVYQRNTQRLSGGQKHVYLRHFDGNAWSAEQRVDQSGDYNMTPALTYLKGDAVVAWVRYDPGSTKLEEFDKRRLALRVMDSAQPEEVLDRLGARVAQPTLAVDGDRVVLAYTRAAAADAFIGTRQALYLGSRNCASTPCAVSGSPMRDRRGRLIYGERPTLLARPGGELSVVMRGLAFGALPGAAFPESNLFADDPVGMQVTTGELLEVRTQLGNSRAEVLALTNDAAWHAQPAATYDALAGEVLALSASVEIESALQKKIAGAGGGRAKVAQIDPGVELASIADLPDLAVDSITGQANRLDPGAVVTLTVTISNRGSAWTTDAEHVATLRAYWDTPQNRGETIASIALGSLDPGVSTTRQIVATVPAGFESDERQSVRVELVVESPDGELDGDNNAAAIALGGMPVPLGVQALTPPGTRFVNLAWNAMADARVAGYRVWIDTPQGPLAIGSSFNAGFADISARYGHQRTYRVSTYSARGIESELSDPVAATPAKALIGDNVFGDDFEGGP